MLPTDQGMPCLVFLAQACFFAISQYTGVRCLAIWHGKCEGLSRLCYRLRVENRKEQGLKSKSRRTIYCLWATSPASDLPPRPWHHSEDTDHFHESQVELNAVLDFQDTSPRNTGNWHPIPDVFWCSCGMGTLGSDYARHWGTILSVFECQKKQ